MIVTNETIAQTFLLVLAQPADALSVFPFYFTVLRQLMVGTVVCILPEYKAQNFFPVWILVNQFRRKLLFF